ncbi:MAG: YgaP family membrane protein [Thermodesulfobacteriota bacterium]
MQVNEGTLDRIVRAALGIFIIALFFAGKLPGYWALLLIFSGTFLMTAVTGYCPLYKPLGVNTCKK